MYYCTRGGTNRAPLAAAVTKVTRIGRNRTCFSGLVSPYRSPRLGPRHQEERGARLPAHFPPQARVGPAPCEGGVTRGQRCSLGEPAPAGWNAKGPRSAALSWRLLPFLPPRAVLAQPPPSCPFGRAAGAPGSALAPGRQKQTHCQGLRRSTFSVPGSLRRIGEPRSRSHSRREQGRGSRKGRPGRKK